MNPCITHGVTKEGVTHPKSRNIEAIVTRIKNKSIIESNKMKGIQLLTQFTSNFLDRNLVKPHLQQGENQRQGTGISCDFVHNLPPFLHWV
jgi:hypothetical protein